MAHETRNWQWTIGVILHLRHLSFPYSRFIAAGHHSSPHIPVYIVVIQVSANFNMTEKQSARFLFPSMVYDMLEEVSDDPKLSKIVSWMPHGRAFKVHRPDDFEAQVMPDYFRERYSSFRYLLEQWSFHGLRRGRDRGGTYYYLWNRASYFFL